MATQTAQGVIARPKAAPGQWREAFGRLRRNRLAMIGLIAVLGLFVIALIGPYIAPYPYYQQDLKAVLANGGQPLPAFSPGHIFGPDQIGRDLFSRLLDGARISMSVAIVVVMLLGLLIMVFVPSIVTWLPDLVFGG